MNEMKHRVSRLIVCDYCDGEGEIDFEDNGYLFTEECSICFGIGSYHAYINPYIIEFEGGQLISLDIKMYDKNPDDITDEEFINQYCMHHYGQLPVSVREIQDVDFIKQKYDFSKHKGDDCIG